MTRQEFIEQYATQDGISVKWAVLGFIEIGDRIQLAMPCACGEDICVGWGMVGPDSVDSHLRLYAPEPLRSAYRAAVARS